MKKGSITGNVSEQYIFQYLTYAPTQEICKMCILIDLHLNSH